MTARLSLLIFASVASVAMRAGATQAAELPPANTGLFYVGDYNDDEIAVYGGDGSYLRSFTAPGLDETRGIVCMPDGTLYVASQRTDEVFVFDATENPTGVLTNAALSKPTGMMVRGDELYVCSYGNDQVVVFGLDGGFRRTFTGGGMNGPNCIALDAAGNMYVASALTARVIKFDANESFVDSFTGGGLSSPMGIARDEDDVLYVAGGGSNNIVKFGTDGSVVGTLSHGDLTGPQGVAFDDRGHLFSSSFYQNHIVEFDASGAYVRTITAGNLHVPRSVAFKRMRIGDVDDNGVIDFADVIMILAAWGPCPDPPAACPADVDGNGVVDFADVLPILANWG